MPFPKKEFNDNENYYDNSLYYPYYTNNADIFVSPNSYKLFSDNMNNPSVFGLFGNPNQTNNFETNTSLFGNYKYNNNQSLFGNGGSLFGNNNPGLFNSNYNSNSLFG